MKPVLRTWLIAGLVLTISALALVNGQGQTDKLPRLTWQSLDSFKTLTPGIDYSADEVLAIYNVPGTPENAKKVLDPKGKLAKVAKAANVTIISSTPIPARASDPSGKNSQVCGKILIQFRLNKRGSISNTIGILDQQGLNIIGGDALYGVAPQGLGLPSQDNNIEQDSWGLEAVKATDLEQTGKEVRVAVLDTGVSKIPAFSTIAPKNWVLINNPTNNADDDFVLAPEGHGTGVAGVVAGRDSTSQAVGVAPDAGIVPVKVCDKTGHCRDSSVVMGICYALSSAAKAKVLNLSLGSFINSPLAEGAIRDAGLENAVVVASAGNTREFPDGHSDFNRTIYPAAFSQDQKLKLEHLISVGAIDQKTNYADYATANNHIDLVAPGVSIMTFKRDGNLYVNASGGTSYAAPYVSGTAALIFSKNPSLAARAVKKIIVGTAESVGCIAPPSIMPASGFLVDPNACGAGLLNVASALSATP